MKAKANHNIHCHKERNTRNLQCFKPKFDTKHLNPKVLFFLFKLTLTIFNFNFNIKNLA
jgi:hypothetical protein